MQLSEQPVLGAGNYLLRPFEFDDIPSVRQAAADPYIPLITTVPVHGTEDEYRQFIERQHQRVTEGSGYSFAIAQKRTNLAVGQIGFWLRNAMDGRASIGYWVSPLHRREGIARQALLAMSEWGLNYPGIDRLELYVEPWNEGSWRTAESCGYMREGLLRSWERVGDTRKDMYMYSRMRPT